MYDNLYKVQQEVFGIFGVNLFYVCYFYIDDFDEFFINLIYCILCDCVEIDMLCVFGLDMGNVDNWIFVFNLVKFGMMDVMMFDLCGLVLQLVIVFYKKNILFMCGCFCLVIKIYIDMVEISFCQFVCDEDVNEENVVMIFELMFKDFMVDGKILDKDFIDCVELLGLLGYMVMIFNYLKYYKMVDYLVNIVKGQKMGFIVGVYNFYMIFDECYYDNLLGGLFEVFGCGFGYYVKMYVYLVLNVENGDLYMLENIQLFKYLFGLLQYMKDNDKIEVIDDFDLYLLFIMFDDVLVKIKMGVFSWEQDVLENVVKVIKYYGLFGYIGEKMCILYYY